MQRLQVIFAVEKSVATSNEHGKASLQGGKEREKGKGVFCHVLLIVKKSANLADISWREKKGRDCHVDVGTGQCE